MTGVMFTWQDSSIIDTRYKHMYQAWLHFQPEMETKVREVLPLSHYAQQALNQW